MNLTGTGISKQIWFNWLGLELLMVFCKPMFHKKAISLPANHHLLFYLVPSENFCGSTVDTREVHVTLKETQG
jgi:hypothetical protein